MRVLGDLPAVSRPGAACAAADRVRGRVGIRHISALLLAACLGGCGGYNFEPESATIALWDSGVPVQAHAGDTLNVPLWALGESNAISVRAPLSQGQRVIIPRHLVPMRIPRTVTSYAPIGH